jgi:hypothetical protein
MNYIGKEAIKIWLHPRNFLVRMGFLSFSHPYVVTNMIKQYRDKPIWRQDQIANYDFYH